MKASRASAEAAGQASTSAVAAVIPARKRQPALTTTKGRSNQNLNNKATVEDRLVVCRHLAWAYLHPERVRQFMDRLLADDNQAEFNQLMSRLEPGLRQKFLDLQAARKPSAAAQTDPAPEVKYLDLIAQSTPTLEAFFASPEGHIGRAQAGYNQAMACDPAHKQVVANESMGRYLAEVATRMQERGIPQARIMVQTHNHVMAMRLEWKTDPSGARRLCIGGYNPNVTGNHRRFEVGTPGELVGQDMAACIEAAVSYSRSGDPKAACFQMICEDVALDAGHERDYLGGAAGLSWPCEETLVCEALGVALSAGKTSVIESMGGFMDENQIPPDARARMLDVNALAGGTLLSSLVRRGDGESVLAYARQLKRAGIEGDRAGEFMRLELPSTRSHFSPEENATYGLYHPAMQAQARADFFKSLALLGVKGASAASVLASTKLEFLLHQESKLLEEHCLHLQRHEVTGRAALPLVTLNPEWIGRMNRGKIVWHYAAVLKLLGVEGDLAAPLIDVVAQGLGTEATADTLRAIDEARKLLNC